MKLANRFQPYFTHRPGTVGICREDRTYEAFICKLCGQVLAPNSAGANSHIAKHVRLKLRAEGEGGER